MLHILLKISKQPFKSVKTNLSKWAIQNQVADPNYSATACQFLL